MNSYAYSPEFFGTHTSIHTGKICIHFERYKWFPFWNNGLSRLNYFPAKRNPNSANFAELQNCLAELKNHCSVCENIICYCTSRVLRDSNVRYIFKFSLSQLQNDLIV